MYLSTFQAVKEKIKYTIAHHFGVQPDKIYLTHPTFFSEITSKPAVTVHDEYWHPHVDKVALAFFFNCFIILRQTIIFDCYFSYKNVRNVVYNYFRKPTNPFITQHCFISVITILTSKEVDLYSLMKNITAQ